MSDLGQQLREARLARGLSLDDVQEMTKIRKRYLEAIESGDYKVLPGSFYVRAFIKTYAETVGVDADELLAEHRQHVPDATPEATMEPVIQKRRSRQHSERNSKWLSTTLMWSFAILILVVIYMYFTLWGNPGRNADGPEPDPTPVTEGKAPESNNDSDQGNTGNLPADGDAVGGNNGTENGSGNDAGTNAGTDLNNEENATNEPGDGTTGELTLVPDGKQGSTTKYKVQNAGNTPAMVTITATGESWVEVRKGSRKGEKLYFGATKDGDVLTYEIGPEGLFVISGASKNTTITVAGETLEDGKATSRFLLNLDNGEPAGEDSATTEDESIDSGGE
ncbi:helix-turn-helix domain-containing protein [Paenibacillus sanguinis]|uniref:helix-turn-helix domain-containing protein n=1 Tax=Paenibacillus sanguinis TaxID=225906 RepID=UPI00035F0E3E|nr:RodZ family helix-turn-helix domain-containing protein [Paenibacillus sanguinis]